MMVQLIVQVRYALGAQRQRVTEWDRWIGYFVTGAHLHNSIPSSNTPKPPEKQKLYKRLLTKNKYPVSHVSDKPKKRY
jgi:hypothetical protein